MGGYIFDMVDECHLKLNAGEVGGGSGVGVDETSADGR